MVYRRFNPGCDCRCPASASNQTTCAVDSSLRLGFLVAHFPQNRVNIYRYTAIDRDWPVPAALCFLDCTGCVPSDACPWTVTGCSGFVGPTTGVCAVMPFIHTCPSAIREAIHCEADGTGEWAAHPPSSPYRPWSLVSPAPRLASSTSACFT